MASNLKIHCFSTCEIMLDEPSIAVLLLNAGVHPDIPPERMRLFGYNERIEWPDGSVAPGILQPICVWYIEANGLRILVDTGVSEENVRRANELFVARGQGQVYVKRPEHDIEAFLAKHGTSCADIDLVVLTHLHLDHFCNAGAFPNARFLVQRKELPWGLTPPKWAQFHWAEFSPYLVDVLDRVETIDGDTKICDGVEAWWVGGHTPGSMAVGVDTALGKVVIAGDFYYNYRNLDHRWPTGSFSSLDEWETNMHVLFQRGDIILPNHDYELWERHPGGVIG